MFHGFISDFVAWTKYLISKRLIPNINDSISISGCDAPFIAIVMQSNCRNTFYVRSCSVCEIKYISEVGSTFAFFNINIDKFSNLTLRCKKGSSRINNSMQKILVDTKIIFKNNCNYSPIHFSVFFHALSLYI